MDIYTAQILEQRLDTLAIGQEFALAVPITDEHCGLKWGKLLYKGFGSCLVRLVEDERWIEVRWASETLVIPNDEASNEEDVMATQPASTPINPIVARFRLQISALAKGDEAKQARAAELLPGILAEADAAGVALQNPANYHAELEGHPLFAERAWAPVEANVAPAATPAVENKGQHKVKPPKTAKGEAVAEARKAAGKDKPKREAKPKREPHDCLDGCGRKVMGTFAPGHDAKLKSLILKIERGDEPMDSLPEIARAHVEFKKGELVTEKDNSGKVTSKVQTYVCTKSPVKIPGR